MTADDFKQVLATMKMSQRRSATAFGVDERTIRRWASGETPIPQTAALLVSFYVPKRKALLYYTDEEIRERSSVYAFLEAARANGDASQHIERCRRILEACVSELARSSPQNFMWSVNAISETEKYDGSELTSCNSAKFIEMTRDMIGQQFVAKALLCVPGAQFPSIGEASRGNVSL